MSTAQKKRSRSGCWTCRKRHQKCDETKPSCANCRIRGVQCGGYDVRLADFTARKGGFDGQMVSRIRRLGRHDESRDRKTPRKEETKSELPAETDPKQYEPEEPSSDRGGTSPTFSVLSLVGVSRDADMCPGGPSVTAKGPSPRVYMADKGDAGQQTCDAGSSAFGFEMHGVAEHDSLGKDADGSPSEHLQEASITSDISPQASYDTVLFDSESLAFHIDVSSFFSLEGALPTETADGDACLDSTALDASDPAGSDVSEFLATDSPAVDEEYQPLFDILSKSSLPQTPSDPFEQYLFAHYLGTLSYRLYPVAKAQNPYHAVYARLAMRSDPVRDAILFASALHLSKLGRLPVFAVQPYRETMRESFRKAIVADDDDESLAATIILTIVFDSIGTGLESWGTNLVGCRRLLQRVLSSSKAFRPELECMIMLYNWAAIMSQTIVKDIQSPDVLEQLVCINDVTVASPDPCGALQTVEGANGQSQWWHNLPDYQMYVLLREATELSRTLDRLRSEPNQSTKEVFQLMPCIFDLVERVKSWRPANSALGEAHTSSIGTSTTSGDRGCSVTSTTSSVK
ncbi:hypothetical protein SAPIO_CDS0007 [Scedosporium apiospermum]|uniref:Zn(2)-C6 fungal-type domain-containing protein n=1 Tax=Pseudallescheria apiosperma TaxID=563466 RepID=A0A084GHB9_PSEDA|nr:uncharacterized protein SAPIO_CDS0007 [Scedosporium apiospermum]KEZ46731.1 hypothetical protein SAPIO_CDS0007 [Scedosporium apiospermum]